MGGDLAELKKNLAKFKKGKHGKGLDDIDIEELDFVSNLCQSLALEKNLRVFFLSTLQGHQDNIQQTLGK